MTEEKPEQSLLEEVKAAVAEFRAENEMRKQLLEREEKLQAVQILSGRTDAGSRPAEPLPETPQEYSKRILRGG